MKVELLRDVEGVGQKGDRVSLSVAEAEKLIKDGDVKEMKGHR